MIEPQASYISRKFIYVSDCLNRLIIVISTHFFFLITFNEQYLLSTVIFAPCLVMYLKKTGTDYFNEPSFELAIKSVYTVIIYLMIAYQTETRTKQSFLGRESADKAFHRWLKIFETFPEGIALIRNNYILYTNKSFKHILEINDLPNHKEDHKNSFLRKRLVETKIIPYISLDMTKGQATNIWQFLMKNEKGQTFELTSTANRYDQERASGTKYITLNQVNVTIAGGKDKLLIVRDVSHIIYLEQIMDTKHEMSLFTDSLMKQI